MERVLLCDHIVFIVETADFRFDSLLFLRIRLLIVDRGGGLIMLVFVLVVKAVIIYYSGSRSLTIAANLDDLVLTHN